MICMGLCRMTVVTCPKIQATRGLRDVMARLIVNNLCHIVV